MINGRLPLIITLYFSESINIDTLDILGITLQSAETLGPDVQRYTLTDGSYVFQNTSTVAINTTEFDFSGIRLVSPLIESVNTSYITIPDGSFVDIAGNVGIGIPTTNALKASLVDIDLTAPDLLSFNLDLNFGTLIMTFSQPLSGDAVIFDRITLQDSFSASTANYTLTSGNSTLLGTREVEIQFSEFDLNQIKADNSLAINRDTTWISALSGFIKGSTGTPSSIVPDNRAIQVTQYTPDFSRPELICYSVFINTGMIVFTFSESVRLSNV